MRSAHATTIAICALLAGCGGGDVPDRKVSISVSPSRALIDQPVAVRVRGLDPGQSALLRSSWKAFGGRRWTGEQRIRASGDGTVVLSEPSELRFLWGMSPAMTPADPSSPFAPPAIEPSTVELAVHATGRPPARASFTRVVARSSVRSRELTMQEDKIAGFLFEPAGGSKGPAVLCVGGSEGGASMVDQAALLASHGHTALALAYFAWPGRPDELRKIPLEYFADAARRLRRDSAGRRVAIMGASRGGEAALLVASAFPDLVAGGVIGLAPSAEVLSSPVSRVAPAWTLRRRPLPPGPIRVELIRGPILVAGADDDQQLPSDLYVQQIEQRLDRKRFAYAHEEIVYEGAGHAIAVALPLLPEADPSRPGGSVEANAAARRDLWRRVLAFLER